MTPKRKTFRKKRIREQMRLAVVDRDLARILLFIPIFALHLLLDKSQFTVRHEHIPKFTHEMLHWPTCRVACSRNK